MEISKEEREYWKAMSREKRECEYQWEKQGMIAEGMEIGRVQGIQEGRVQGIDEGRAQGIDEGRAKGIEENLDQSIEQGQVEAQQEIALNMLQKGYQISAISEVIGLSTTEIEQLKNKHGETMMPLKYPVEVSEEAREYMASLARDEYNLDYGWERKKKKWLDEGIEKGLAQGIEEGRVEGMERGREQGMHEGRAQGVYEGLIQGTKKGMEERQRKIALNMLQKGYEVSVISKLTCLSVAEIKQLKK